jgi:hypothetical protein
MRNAVFVSSRRPFARSLVWAALAMLLSGVPTEPCSGQETLLPQQLIFPPLPLDPLDFEQSKPIDVGVRVYHLPDSRRGENYTVRGWVGIGKSHAFSWEFAYAGVEDGENIRYGGGAPRWQWTTHLGRPGTRGFAFDVAVVPPVGDETLHPVCGRASSLHARLRYSPLGGKTWRFWLGYWSQSVSAPDKEDPPSAYYPSGHGFDVACHGATARWAWELWVHGLRGNLPENTWLEANATVFPVADLGLKLGATVTPGPVDLRLMDVGWQVAIVWRPAPLEEDDAAPGRAPAGESLSRGF